MSPFQNGTERSMCCFCRNTEFKSFDGLLRPQPIPRLINEKQGHRGKSWDESRPTASQCWCQRGVLVIEPRHHLFPIAWATPLTPALFIILSTFQHRNITHCKFTTLCSSYLLERQYKELMDQFLRSGHHWNINTFSFSLWSTWLVRFTNYVK